MRTYLEIWILLGVCVLHMDMCISWWPTHEFLPNSSTVRTTLCRTDRSGYNINSFGAEAVLGVRPSSRNRTVATPCRSHGGRRVMHLLRLLRRLTVTRSKSQDHNSPTIPITNTRTTTTWHREEKTRQHRLGNLDNTCPFCFSRLPFGTITTIL